MTLWNNVETWTYCRIMPETLVLRKVTMTGVTLTVSHHCTLYIILNYRSWSLSCKVVVEGGIKLLTHNCETRSRSLSCKIVWRQRLKHMDLDCQTFLLTLRATTGNQFELANFIHHWNVKSEPCPDLSIRMREDSASSCYVILPQIQSHLDQEAQIQSHLDQEAQIQSHLDQEAQIQSHLDQEAQIQSHLDQETRDESALSFDVIGWYCHSRLSLDNASQWVRA